MLPLGGLHVNHAVQRGTWAPTQHLLWDQGKPRQVLIDFAGRTSRLDRVLVGLLQGSLRYWVRQFLQTFTANFVSLNKTRTEHALHLWKQPSWFQLRGRSRWQYWIVQQHVHQTCNVLLHYGSRKCRVRPLHKFGYFIKVVKLFSKHTLHISLTLALEPIPMAKSRSWPAETWTLGARFSAKEMDFSLLHIVYTGSGLHSAYCPIDTEVSLLKKSQSGCESDHSPSRCVMAKNSEAIPPLRLTPSWHSA
jgi:hypothetical protein